MVLHDRKSRMGEAIASQAVCMSVRVHRESCYSLSACLLAAKQDSDSYAEHTSFILSTEYERAVGVEKGES